MTICKCGHHNVQPNVPCEKCGAKIVASPAYSLFSLAISKQIEAIERQKQTKAHPEKLAEPTVHKQTVKQEKKQKIQQKPRATEQIKKPFKKKLKKAFFTTTTVVVLGFTGLIALGNAIDEPAEIVEVSAGNPLYTAFESRDVEAIYDAITFPEDAYYDEQAVKKYLKALDLKQMGEQIQSFMNDENEQDFQLLDPIMEIPLIEVQKEKATFTLTAIAHETTFATNNPDLNVIVDGQTYNIAQFDQSLQAIFGIYELEVQGMVGDYDVDFVKEVMVPNEAGHVIQIDVDTYSVQYRSDYEEMELIVNGNPKADYASYPRELTDIPQGTELELYGVIEYEGTTYKSNVVNVSDQTTVQFEFSQYEQMLQQQQQEEQLADIEQQALDVVSDFYYYYENGDVDSLEQVVNPTSKLYEEHVAMMNRLAEKGTEIFIEHYTFDSFNEIGDGEYELAATENYRLEKVADTTYLEQLAIYKLKMIEGILYIEAIDISNQ